MRDPLPIEQALLRHDQKVDESGLSIWVGAEPTFTDRSSEAAEWLYEAGGANKEERAQHLLRLLKAQRPGAVVLRTIGRQYSGEPRPRWSYGLYCLRDGTPAWAGPPDPLEGEPAPAPEPERVRQLEAALVRALCSRGWLADSVPCSDQRERRVVFRCDGSKPVADPALEPRLSRSSVHDQRLPEIGLQDDLASTGSHLLALSLTSRPATAPVQLWLELPKFARVPDFLAFLELLGAAAAEAQLARLVLCGFAPPVDQSVAWTTLTPDPAVLEVNQAPAADLRTFLDWNRELYALAEQIGLSPCRLHYSGAITDSGGGGQITLGGPTPEASPFFVAPHVLPRLVRYLLRHPALSYWFATQYLGASSQSPRPDEGLLDSFHELGVALEQLARAEHPEPALLWNSLRHFLTDSAGNPHRSELNVEKLWNPYLSGRGCLGLVEFRALRMAPTPTHLAAVAALLRSLVLMLSQKDSVPELTHWGSELHERFALPSLLRVDLEQVLSDLRREGLGLGNEIEAELLGHENRRIGTLTLAGCRLDVEQALEFWPLVGDVASQEAGGSRLVDASTSRLEVRLSRVDPNAGSWQDWRLLVNQYRIELRQEPDLPGDVRLLGIRYRTFVPKFGLHPSLGADGQIVLQLQHLPSQAGLRACWHGWRPGGGGYSGLPADPAEAARRRAERFVVEPLVPSEWPTAKEPRASALSPYCFDLRRA